MKNSQMWSVINKNLDFDFKKVSFTSYITCGSVGLLLGFMYFGAMVKREFKCYFPVSIPLALPNFSIQ